MSKIALAWNDDGSIARTYNLEAVVPSWKRVNGSIVGNVNDAVFDWWSDYFESGILSGDLGVYAVATDGSTLRIYYTEDVLATTVSWTQQASFTVLDNLGNADASVETSARIVVSQDHSGLVLAAWRSLGVTYYTRSTNHGTTWSTPAKVNNGGIDPALTFPNIDIGIDIRDVTQVSSGFLLGSSEFAPLESVYRLDTSTDTSWTRINQSELVFLGPVRLAVIDQVNNRLYASGRRQVFSLLINFDANNSNYTLSGEANVGLFLVGHNMARAFGPRTVVQSLWLEVTVDLGSDRTIERIFYHRNKVCCQNNGQTWATLKDASGNTLYTTPTAGVTENTWTEYHAIFEPVNNVRTVVIRIQATSQGLPNSCPGDAYVAVDNIDIYGKHEPRLYKISNYTTTSPGTADITASGYAPLYPHGLAIDSQDADKLAMVGQNELGETRLFTSNNQGQNWTDRGTVSYQSVTRLNDRLLLAGPGKFDLSTDLGSTTKNRLGNWATSVGPVGTIRGFIEPGAGTGTASFSVDVTRGDAPLTVQFSNTTPGIIDTNEWDFGDGNTSTQSSPSHTFTEPGIYKVRLKVTFANGAIDYAHRTLHVYDPETGAVPKPESHHKTGDSNECDLGVHKVSGKEKSKMPISLLLGEKREEITDLSVNTPAGVLAFTRLYRQSKQSDSHYEFMGLGWTHNHDIFLNEVTGIVDKIIVTMSGGGEAEFVKQTDSNRYQGSPGSTSFIDVDTGSTEARYILTTVSGSVFTFDSDGLLRSRLWTTGESWVYNYDSNQRLTEVIDDAYDLGSGVYRKLSFSYYTSGPYLDQLQRVEDHTGRFVEFAYVPNKVLDGAAIVDGSKWLLSAVTDVRENVWLYDHYGQNPAETDTAQLNFLTKAISPSVDMTGDGNPDASITLKTLDYTLNGSDISQITQKFGVQGTSQPLMETDYTFQLSGSSASTIVTEEVTAGKVTKYRFANGVYAGAEDPAGNYNAQSLDPQYRVERQKDAEGRETLLEWSEDGKHLQQVTNALGDPTQFVYDVDDRLHASLDAEGRQTIYVYEDIENPRQPTTVLLPDNTNPNVATEMSTDWNWDSVNTPAVHQLVPHPASAHFMRYVVAEEDEGIEGNTWDLDSGSIYTVTVQVYVISGAVKMQVPGETAFDVILTGTEAWRTLTATHTPSTGSTGKQLQFLAYGGAAEFYVSAVSIRKDGIELAENGTMGQDTGWNDVGSPSTNIRLIGPDTEDYTHRVVATIADQGIQSNAWDIVADQAYLILARVYPVSGTVRMKVAGVAGFDQVTSDNGAWETLRAVYKPTTSNTGVRLQFLSEGDGSEFYVNGVYILDAPHIERWQEFTYDERGRTLTEKTIDPANPTGDPLQQVSRTYGTSGTSNGLLESVEQHDLTDPSNDVTTTYTYNNAGRVIKTHQSSLFGSCQVSYTVYDAADNVVASICNYENTGAAPTTAAEAEALYDEEDPDTNRVTTHEYDTLGRRVTTTVNAGASFAQTTLTVYDELNRVIRTITNYVLDESIPNPYTAAHNAFSHGADNTLNFVTDTAYNARGLVRKQTDVRGNITLYGYDDADRLVKTVQNASQPNYNNDYAGTSPDPDLSSYPPNANADQDITSTNEYDAVGNLVMAVDALSNVTYTVYDALNRPVKTVRNAKDDATITLNPGDMGYSAANDPRSASYVPSSTLDRDLIETTEYDAMSRVRRTQDVLGTWTLYGYDLLGRQVKVIRSASNPTFDLVSDPDLSDYIPSIDPDQDIVTQTVYDEHGRALYTQDPLEVRTWFKYDGLGRQVKTIASAVGTDTDGGVNDPRSDSYTSSTDPDKDLITLTTYNIDGQVESTEDTLGRVTRYVYDAVGRRLRTVTNFVDQGEDPSLWVWSNGWKQSDEVTPIDHGADEDENIISSTAYDNAGRLLYTEDTLARRTWVAYDGLGRQVKTIASAVGTDTDGGVNDPRSDSYMPSVDPDKDLITLTTYNVDGQVESTEDILGRVTRYVYDAVGRRVRTVTNFVDQGEDPSLWVWNNGWKQSDEVTPIDHGADDDENIVSSSIYDVLGRVVQTTDHRNNATVFVYDHLGRPTMTITNYTEQGTSDPADWIWDAGDTQWENGASTAIDFGIDKDQNAIVTTAYDRAGRILRTRDAAGMETRHEYDAVGRRTESIINYGNGVFSSATPDEDLISTTTYTKVGQVVSTVDARGTTTAFSYDQVGRQRTITQAAESSLETTAYTCYDKAGRVLRVIQNWSNESTQPSPDTKDGGGNWLFIPPHNGPYNDRDLITTYEYDQLNRHIKVTDPVSNFSTTTYFLNGQVRSLTDPEEMVSHYRYDQLNRRTRVIQGFQENEEDPSLWLWESGDQRWEQSDETAIEHGAANDRNIIVDVIYDKAGRMISLRDPRGNLTTYVYDQLNRRKSLTNPLNNTWETEYENLVTGGTLTTMTYPNGATHQVQREFDRQGRLKSIQYLNESPKDTPDVKFTYTIAGNRTAISEYIDPGFTNRVRETQYSYDDVRRLTSVGFDNDGSGSIDQTVSYEYDAGSLRTKLTLPGSLNVTYSYDTKGRLVSLTDWDSQSTTFAHDNANRLLSSVRANGLRCRYSYDAASRLRWLRHTKDSRTLAHFAYDVDRRGNRTRALEALAAPVVTSDTIIAYDNIATVHKGTWSDDDPFKVTTDTGASLEFMFMVNLSAATLPQFTFGMGPDHGIFDVYVGGTLWQSFDGYEASASERTVSLNLSEEGPLAFEIRTRPEKNLASSGYTVRFKQLLLPEVAYSVQTIQYQYDLLSRLLSADNYLGLNANATPMDAFAYTYDLAGNRLSQSQAIDFSTPTVTNYTYNVANQITNSGFTYDANGNLTGDGTYTYTWDRANRLLNKSGGTYSYDGLGNRIERNNIQYLLDLQPGLSVVLAETQGANTTRYVHGPAGIHAHKDNAGNWEWMIQDGLGSVRSVVDNNLDVLDVRFYEPYGDLYAVAGATQTIYGFTGEPNDTNGLVHLRARHYAPDLGVFPSLDPFEGTMQRPMSLNGYSWVEGNVPNAADPSGMFNWSRFMVEQYDSLWSIAYEGGVPTSRFSAFVAAVQALNNAPYLETTLPSATPNNWCANAFSFLENELVPVGFQDDVACGVIFPQPVVFPDRICFGYQLLIPDAIPGVQNIIATGRSRRGGNPPPQTFTPSTIPVRGIRLATDATQGLLSQLSYTPDQINYDNLGISFEWYRSLTSSRAGWFVNVLFTVTPSNASGAVNIGGGSLHGVFETWPSPGSYGASQSFAGSFGPGNFGGTIERSSAPDGSYVWYIGASAGADVIPLDALVPLLTFSQSVSASLYLGDSPSPDLTSLLQMLTEPSNFEKFLYLVDLVGAQSL